MEMPVCRMGALSGWLAPLSGISFLIRPVLSLLVLSLCCLLSISSDGQCPPPLCQCPRTPPATFLESMPERTQKSDAPGMSPPASRFVPQPTSRQKDSGQDIRCAEIKTIPTMKSSDQDRGPKTFKIGEYNRATASFEIPSLANTPVAEVEVGMPSPKPEFDFTADFVSDQYFQSSFARSVASSQSSKSLDHGVNSKVSVSAVDSGVASMSVSTPARHNGVHTTKSMVGGNDDMIGGYNNSNGCSESENQRFWQIPGKEVRSFKQFTRIRINAKKF